MELVRAQLKLSIAIEKYNETCKTADWALIKKAGDKVKAAIVEYQCAKLGLR